MKTVKFHTFGCKVNQYDTQDIREQFLRAGFLEPGNGRPADVYVVNTCTVTHKADRESLSCIRRARRNNPGARIIVTGCLAELDRAPIKREGVDLIVRNRDKGILVSQLQSLRTPNAVRGEAISEDSEIASSPPGTMAGPRNDGSGVIAGTGISYFEGRTRAFLKIQDGCDNFCSYCKVPLVRGRSISKPLEDIVGEAARIIGNGYKEIVLTGVCLGSYNSYSHCEESRRSPSARSGRRSNLKNKASLVDVILALEKINGLLRIRLSSIEAGDVTGDLIEVLASSKKLCPHLHIPIQSGDDAILKKMNRKYNGDDYRCLIKKIKKRIPDIAITTDVLVGFPGEREDNFRNTVRLTEEILPLKVHIFPYSRREGTSAAGLSGEVDQLEIKKRILRLRKAADRCALEYQKRFLNKTMPVLMEGPCRNNPGFWEGHTANYIKVSVVSKRDITNMVVLTQIRAVYKEYAEAYFC